MIVFCVLGKLYYEWHLLSVFDDFNKAKDYTEKQKKLFDDFEIIQRIVY